MPSLIDRSASANARQPAELTLPNPSRSPAKRRGRIIGGLVVMLLGGWVSGAAYASAGNRVQVVQLVRPVSQYDTLSSADLRVASVARADGVPTLAAGDLHALVGRVASTDLVSGSLLSGAELLPPGTQPVDPTEAVVGASLAAGDSPQQLSQGAAVLVVVRPAAGSAGTVTTVHGRVLKVGSTNANSNDARQVSLVVPAVNAGTVSAAAADGRVTVAALGAGR